MTTKPEFATFTGFAELMIQTYERYLPTAFDDGLTQLQKMNKIIVYLNEVGKVTTDAFTRWNEVMEWVMNDGLETTVSNELDSMVADGTFNSIINHDLLGSRARVEVSYTEPTTPDDRTYWLEKRSDEDVQIKYRNGTSWTNIFPVTQESNVVAEDGVTLNNKLVTINNEISGIKNNRIYWKDIYEFGAIGDGVADDTEALKALLWYGYTNKNDSTGKRVKLVIPSGTYLIKQPMAAFSGVDVEMDKGAHLKFDLTTRHGIMFDGTKNAKWSGGKISRIGSTSERYANVVEVKWDADNTLVFEGVTFKNEMVPVGNDVNCSGMMIHASASPIVKDCIAYGGGNGDANNGQFCQGFRIGGTGYSKTSPIFYNCIGYGGKARTSSGFEINNTLEGGNIQLFNCTAYGGTGNYGYGIAVDDVSKGTIIGCVAYGGDAGVSNHGLMVWGAVDLVFKDCVFFGGNKTGVAANYCSGVYTHNGYVSFDGCKAYSGLNTYYGASWYIDTGHVTLNNCVGESPKSNARLEYSSTNKALTVFPYNMDYEIKFLAFQCLANLSGVTVNIGTTEGGSDIATNIQLANYNWVRIFDHANFNKPLTGSKIYITPSVAIPDGQLMVIGTFGLGRQHYTLIVLPTGKVKANNSHFIVANSNSGNKAVNIGANATADNVKLRNCVVEAVGHAIYSETSYDDVHFPNSTIIGTKTGLV